MKKSCVIEGCPYENTPGCRAEGLGVEGITKCVKYDEWKEKNKGK